MIVCDDKESSSARRVYSEDHRIRDRMLTLGFATLDKLPLLFPTDLNKKTIKLCLGSRFNTILHAKYCSCYGNLTF